MSGLRTYLDWNATAAVAPLRRAAMLAALDCVGNASSPHAEGRRPRALMEGAREQIADCLGADPRRVYFYLEGDGGRQLAADAQRGRRRRKAAFELVAGRC